MADLPRPSGTASMTIAGPIVTGANLSDAWLSALRTVRDSPGGDLFHLVTRIERPLPEDLAIRAAADHLLSSLGHDSVHTVANTIFPSSLAATCANADELSARYRAMYGRVRVLERSNDGGTYFGRIVAYPARAENHDQLATVIGKIQRENAGRAPKSARYEISVYTPGTDNSIMGFPCLSSCSFQLDRGRLHLVAHYRSQYLVQRGYGNYLGLARLQEYIAAQAGVLSGEMTVVAGHARADAAKYKIAEVTAALT